MTGVRAQTPDGTSASSSPSVRNRNGLVFLTTSGGVVPRSLTSSQHSQCHDQACSRGPRSGLGLPGPLGPASRTPGEGRKEHPRGQPAWPVSRVGQLAGPPGLKGGCAPGARFLVTVGNSSFSGAREPWGPALPFLPSLADSQPSEDPATGEIRSWLHPQTQAHQRPRQTNLQPPAPGAWGCTLTGKRAPAGSLPLPCGSVPECSCACSPLGPGRVLAGR